MAMSRNQPGMTFALALSTAVASLGGLLFGFDTAVIAGTTHALTLYFQLTPAALGITVSCALWGTVAGCLLAPFPAKRFGGRESLRLVGVLYLISALGCALSRDWAIFLCFRFLGGLAIGGCSIFAPMYMAESSPPSIRGKVVGCFQLSIVTGILLAYASNFAVDLRHFGVLDWRVKLGIAAVPSLLFLLALGWIPRSPRWLVSKGRLSEAASSLEAVGFDDAPNEIRRIQGSLTRDAGQNASVFAAAYRKPLFIALALGFFNQFSGINAILYYLNDIFANAGFASVSAGQQAVAVGGANLLFTLVGMALIDRVGRKPLLLAGSVGMAAALAGVTILFFSNSHKWLLLPLLVLFIACFAASQGAVVWVYLSEIFPNAVRASGQSLASFWLWLLTATLTGFFPSLAAVSNGSVFLLFTAAMVAQFFVVLVYFPETRGRSLESIQDA